MTAIPFVVIDENEHTINHLMARKIFCVHGESSDENVLLKSNIRSARILIANQNDEKNASIILTAKELCNIKVISLVEDIAKEGYLKYAGADQVISLKHYSGLILEERLSIRLLIILQEQHGFLKTWISLNSRYIPAANWYHETKGCKDPTRNWRKYRWTLDKRPAIIESRTWRYNKRKLRAACCWNWETAWSIKKNDTVKHGKAGKALYSHRIWRCGA